MYNGTLAFRFYPNLQLCHDIFDQRMFDINDLMFYIGLLASTRHLVEVIIVHMRRVGDQASRLQIRISAAIETKLAFKILL